MDDPLREKAKSFTMKFQKVLILIVMDDPLRGFLEQCDGNKCPVLILIVMDDPLRGQQWYCPIKTSNSLNPYCNG